MVEQRYLILFFAFVQVCLGNEPSLIILPESISKAVGDGAYVSCTAQVDDAALVTEMSWTAPNGNRITNNNEETVSTAEDGTMGKLDLVISSLKEQDVGEYTCSATYASNRKLEAKVMVDSYTEIDFGDTPKHQTLLIGEEGKIKCTPRAKPAPQVNWFKNKIQLKNDNNHIIQQDGILITEVSVADEGTYRCRARVVVLGSVKHIDIQVEVNIPPIINVVPQNITGKEHEEATFQCSATGKPPPAYSWVDNNNAPLMNGDDFHVNSETGVLKIMNLRPEQSGEYRCTAENSAGDDFKTAHLQVYSKPKVEEYLNLTVQESNDLEMRCTVSGSPAPRIIFKKESEATNFTQGINTDERITVTQEKDEHGREVGILQISDVMRRDDGLYTCTAESGGGVTQSWGHITVEFTPTFEEQVVTTQWSWEKAPVNLTCLATSIPNATIQWYLHNKEIDANDVNVERLEMGPLGVLRVNPVSSSYFGFYTCKASNTLGTASQDVELKEAHPPGPITSAKVDKVTATTISWGLVDPTNDGGLPIQGYIVEYREAEHSWEDAQRNQWNKGSSYTIDNLTPLATYVFRFAARSRVGIGEWGGEKSQEMPGHAEPEEPLIFDAANMDIPYSNHYDLQWEVPLNNGKAIDKFQIVYYQVKKKGEEWEASGKKTTREVNYPGTSSYKIEGLHSDTHYKIELRAHNDIGFSQPAEAVIKTARGRDQLPTSEESSANPGLIVVIIIVVIIVLALVIDASCFFIKRVGLIAIVTRKFSAKDKDKETMLEDGKNVSDEKPEGNGQMKSEKDELKPEQPNSDKKEPSEPTETTPMIQGRVLQSHVKDVRLRKAVSVFETDEVSRVSLLPPTPTHGSTPNILSEHPLRSQAAIHTTPKPIIVKVHEKHMKKVNDNHWNANLMNNPSFSLLDQSFSDDSLYAKPSDVNILKEDTTHRKHSEEPLSNMLHPITIGIEDVTYHKSQIPHCNYTHKDPTSLGSREILHQEPKLSTTEAFKYRSQDALSKSNERLHPISMSKNILNQPKNNENQKDDCRMQSSFISNSRDMINYPPLSSSNLPLRPPSVHSCSTHYQPTDAMLDQNLTQAAYLIAPYDHPTIPTKPQNLNKTPHIQDIKTTLRKDTQHNMWSIPAPPSREEEKKYLVENKEGLKYSGHSYSMDNLDSTLDYNHLQPSSNKIWSLYQHNLPTTKSLNNLYNSTSGLRCYDKPTLL